MKAMNTMNSKALAAGFSKARKASIGQDVSAVFAILCATFDNVLGSRSESVVSEALAALPLPVDCVRVVRTESGFKVRSLAESPARKQCDDLMTYIAAFVDSLPGQRLAERLEVMARHCSQRCMSSAAKLPAKRRQLWLLTSLRVWLSQQQKSPLKLLEQQGFMLAYLLHEPESSIRRLWREHTFWFHFNYAKRLLHLNNRPESTGYLDGFDWPDRSDYCRLVQNNKASRVLVTIHMGDFFGAFRVISTVSDSGRKAISMRRDATGNHGMQHFSADRITHRVFFHRQHQAVGVVSALRQGHHTLATLFDLRDDFGSTVTVNFFGHPARVVKGPAQLAILGRSPIFPFVCFERQGRNCIEMAPVIDTRLRPEESLHDATARITQTLVDLAESWIRRWPTQWKYLTALPAYFEVTP